MIPIAPSALTLAKRIGINDRAWAENLMWIELAHANPMIVSLHGRARDVIKYIDLILEAA